MSTYSTKGARVTINDIAREAGVSKSTVSLVLNKSERIKPDTAARVFAAAEKLGYVYNRGAATLRQGSSNIIGMVVNDLKNPFFVELLVGMEKHFSSSDFVTFLAHTDESAEVQEKVIATMCEYKAAGIVICPAFKSDSRIIDKLRNYGIPVVSVMRNFSNGACDFLGMDNMRAMEMATQHLIDLGHARIAFIGFRLNSDVSEQRYSGYVSTLHKNGISSNPDYCFPVSLNVSGGEQACMEILEMKMKPTAAVCFNDQVAIGVLNVLNLHGIRAGNDFSVVGCDGTTNSKNTFPPLTTLAQHPEKLGEEASSILLDRIRNPEKPIVTIARAPELIVRASTGAA